MNGKKTTRDAVEILHKHFVKNNPEMEQALLEVRAERRIATAIAELRGRLGLSTKRFAVLVGTTASVIRQLEDADYDGNAAHMLEKIAAAVQHKLELEFRFVPAKKAKRMKARVPA